MATDTAIAMGVLAALAARVPKSKACRTHPSETSGRGTSGRYRLHHVNIYRASRSATAKRVAGVSQTGNRRVISHRRGHRFRRVALLVT